jgi:hypothetical protein
MKAAAKAGYHPVGIASDGTVIVAEKPIDVTSLVPVDAQPSPPAKERRMGDYFHGGSSEAEGT